VCDCVSSVRFVVPRWSKLSGRELGGQKAHVEEGFEERCSAPVLLYTDHVVGEGERFFAEIERIGLEGMVAKKVDSFYVGSRSRDWLKIKTEVGRIEMQGRSERWHG
jgi:ATP-dependent DNA ligase